jgi:hypothetical protein
MGGTTRVLASRTPFHGNPQALFHRYLSDDAPLGVGTGTR